MPLIGKRIPKMTEKEEMKLEVPSHVYEQIEREISNTDFRSVEDYVGFVLTQLSTENNVGTNQSEISEEQVEERLESLGYIE